MKSFIEISLISVFFLCGYLTAATCSYIVTLKSSTEDNVLEAHLDKVRKLFVSDQGSGGKNKINYEYCKVLLGYSAEFTDEILAKIKAMPEVEDIEENQLVEVAAIQAEATWRLARLSSDTQLPNNPGLWSYSYDPSAGEGVDVFVIDSGIQINHPDFEGRVKWGETLLTM
ncbi:proteinase B [Entomophthora muscae]|uniref:Proteinase B n=1 Tax=Entomophthora muscae TaxID=34485 RepID=A0ACC2SI20_9FUNG|nr:proteinase B [Entomophthora muscae]